MFALTVVLFVRLRFTSLKLSIYEEIIIRIIISDLIFEITEFANSWWLNDIINCYLFTTINNIPLAYSILNSYLISYISW